LTLVLPQGWTLHGRDLRLHAKFAHYLLHIGEQKVDLLLLKQDNVVFLPQPIFKHLHFPLKVGHIL
jgi:hypothetical protein